MPQKSSHPQHQPHWVKTPPSVTYSDLIVIIFSQAELFNSSEKNKLINFFHISTQQIRHVWTRAVSELGYVGALQKPILHIGPKDQKSN